MRADLNRTTQVILTMSEAEAGMLLALCQNVPEGTDQAIGDFMEATFKELKAALK
jgi:hypothetical protein